jgi:ergothioneine biosynthesis protein EgtB
MKVSGGHETKTLTLEGDVTNLRERYISVRAYTEEICKPLETEDFVVQPNPEINPPKWHLAHTTWFFEQFVLSEYHPNYALFHAEYHMLFGDNHSEGVESVPVIDRGNLSRPTVGQIREYRRHVDQRMLEIIDLIPEKGLHIIEAGCNHEQQHQELLFADIKYILGHNPLFPVYKATFFETRESDDDRNFAFIPEGEYPIGYNGYGFSFGNEQRQHHVMLRSFQVRKSLITNNEFLEFIDSGGYQRPEYWLSDGWQWVKAKEIEAPLYWHKVEQAWHRYALSGLESVNGSEPVTHVSFYEAAAFASWAGMRLPTEFEWEAAADQFHWGQRWEHTNSAYLPYPGYVKPEGAWAEYGGKFMVNAMVLRGASVVTPPNHSRKTYRNFFYPHMRTQFSGIRLCKV